MPPFNLNQFGVEHRRPDRVAAHILLCELRGHPSAPGAELHPGRAECCIPHWGHRRISSPSFRSIRREPARTSNADIDDWEGTERVTNDENAILARVDHRFSDKTTVFARYNFDQADLVSPG